MSMNWNGKTIETVRDLFDAIWTLADRNEAQRFIAEYRSVNPHADSDAGYVIGYGGDENRRRELYDWLGVGHPVFGTAL